MDTARLRASAVAAIASAILVAPLITWQGATGSETRSIVVVGDSITARYNDRVGNGRQGWWSMVGRHYDAAVTTYAQSGSGYLRPGDLCRGNRFIDRSRALTGPPPTYFIVEGGRNDWSTCHRGRYVVAPDNVIKAAVDRYLTTVKRAMPQSTRIIVLGPPWGPLDPLTGDRITAIVEAAADRHGVQFVSMSGALTDARVVDGVHPNRAGNRAIAIKVVRALGG